MSRGRPRLAAFPTEAAFLPALANAWLAEPGDPAAGLIILPNRRAARALAAAFLPANQGKALLLPRIIAPGAIDEAGLALTGALSLPPAVPILTRQSILARLILLNKAEGAPRKLAAAWRLAADLAALLDEADEAEIDLAETLPNVVAAELASHWQTTLEFLAIITHHWPAILADMGMLNPTARQSTLIDAQAEAWASNPPGEKIWLVTAAANPALTRLAAVVAGLPNGAVILPSYDWNLDDAAWEFVEDQHPSAGIARLLTALGARREEVAIWPAPESATPGRTKLLSQALLPAGALESWQSQSAFDLTGIHRLNAGDEQQEATAIAMALRNALETPGATTALITPDRGLATRVAAALKRFGITADDSAGEALTDTPPAIFLRLLSRAAAAEFAPLPLLALLKHPLTAAGEKPETCRANARALEQKVLRGPRPSPGFDGIKFRLEKHGSEALKGFVDRLELRLRPVAGLPVASSPADALHALITAAEALAETADSPGSGKLWSGEAGTALSTLLAEALPVLEDQPPIAPDDLPELLDALLEGHVIRRPRAKDGHPRIAIWGVQEAMLQTVDTAILGGLVEGVWPSLPEPGPWLSRPMRKAAGLPSPEQEIGAAAHAFFALGSRCGEIILSAPTRRDRAPAVPARWLTRLDALLAATGQVFSPHPAAAWALLLDTPLVRIQRPKPAPRPASHLRPATLSISDIATLIADPYAIYAKHILRIHQLDPLDEESDPSLFGNIVHAGLQKFFSVNRDFDAPDAAAQLTLALQIAMREQRPRAALENWWAARLERIAGWIIDAECERRSKNPPVEMALERSGNLQIPGGFKLKGRADRIEKREDGSVFIMDYKTGAPPSERAVSTGAAPQLPLEAVMAEAGSFGLDLQGPVTELGFWKLSGRNTNGEDKPLFSKDPAKLRQVIETAAEQLPALFNKFARETTPYLATPHPSRSTYDDPYHGISRRGEWGGEGSDDA